MLFSQKKEKKIVINSNLRSILKKKMLILELLFYPPIIIVTNNNLSLVRNIFLLTKFNNNLSIAFRFNKFISPSLSS